MGQPLTNAEKAAIQEAACFYLEPFTPLLTAMVEAEGGPEAFILAIQCSMPNVTTFEAALAYGCKTIRHRVLDFQVRGIGMLLDNWPRAGVDPWTGEPNPHRLLVSDRFIRFLAARWAPVGAENDPNGLNANWPRNVADRQAKAGGISNA